MELLFSEPSCRDAQVFDGLAGMNIGMVVNWLDRSSSYKLAGTHATDNFFAVTGIPVAMGRPVELGRRLVLDGKPYTVVGVLPRGIAHPAAYARLKPILSEMDRVFRDRNREWAEGAKLSGVSGMDRPEPQGGAGMAIGLGVAVVAVRPLSWPACFHSSRRWQRWRQRYAPCESTLPWLRETNKPAFPF